MSLNTLSLLKLKKKCQETLYNSISRELDFKNTQTYIPIFSEFTKFENNFSKQMFIPNSKYIMLEINSSNKDLANNNNKSDKTIDFENINLNESSNRSNDVSDKFDIIKYFVDELEFNLD